MRMREGARERKLKPYKTIERKERAEERSRKKREEERARENKQVQKKEKQRAIQNKPNQHGGKERKKE